MGKRAIVLGGVTILMATVCAQAEARTVVTTPPPPPPAVQEETYGDWYVQRLTASAIIAGTTNDAGSVFGVICDASLCQAFFNPQIPCADGNSYPALANAPAAAFAVTITCKQIDDLHIYSLPLEGGVTEAMSVGGVFGIAFPLKSGQFQVARFSLTGAARASARAQQLARWNAPSAPENVSDEFTL